MIKMKRRGLKAGLACAVVLMFLVGMMPSGVITSQKVRAETGKYGENEDGTLYYAETWLYDYKYDRELNSSYEYTRDNQIAYRRNSDGVVMSESDCHNLQNGDRWMTGLQVPYELLNRKISAFYDGKDAPALYFGNFYGTANNLNEKRGNGEGETPYQYTYISGQNGNQSYADAYKQFWESANAAPLNNNGNVAMQGLVDRKLTGGTLTQNNGAFELPQFSDSFIGQNSNMITKYTTRSGFPFNIVYNPDGTKTYEFDSANDATRYYNGGTNDGGDIVVGNIPSNGVGNWRSDGNPATAGGYGFFPFNSSSITTTEVGRSQVNYGFGMKVNIPFNLDENGTILDKDGNEVDVVFRFSGDDDVWVFVDDVLILDMGGDHAKVTGNINFNRSKQQVYIDYASVFDKTKDRKQKATRKDNSGPKESTIAGMYQAAGESFDEDTFYNPTTQHTLTVFYMERGMFESNLSISFNFATLNPHTLAVREQTLFKHINRGLIKQTIAVADKDIFQYSIENKGTTQDAVKDSGLKTPTYDYINRNNTEEGNTNLINRLSGQQPDYESVTNVSFDDEHIYLQPESSWVKNNREIAAWVWKSGGTDMNSHYVRFTFDNENNCYKANRDGATGMKLVCYEAGNAPNEGSTNWKDGVHASGDITIPIGKNKYLGESKEWSAESVNITTTFDRLKQETHKFEPSGTDFNAVDGVTYQLSDSFGVDKNTNQEKTTLTRDTENGRFNLMYGEEAFFAYQFAKGSTMRVKQEAALLQPMDNRAENMGSRTGDRALADYYRTQVYVEDIEIQRILEKNNDEFDEYNSDGTYKFENHPETSDKTVHLTETYVNTVRVGAIGMKKILDPEEAVMIADQGETGSGTVVQTPAFTFRLVLTELFGDQTQDGNVTDYSGIDVFVNGQVTTLSEDGEFTLLPGQEIIIENIPVHTHYEFREVLPDDSYFRLKSDAGDNIVYSDYVTECDGGSIGKFAMATNTRKVGKLKITKTVTGSGMSADDSFPVTVALHAPAGVNLSDYMSSDDIVLNSYVTDLSDELPNIAFTVKDKAVVTISNIPYGTTYVITEEAGQYTGTITYSDDDKIINQEDEDVVQLVNTLEAASIVLTKKNNYSVTVPGAEFAIYLNESDAKAKNNNVVSTAEYEKNREGTVFTFSKLTPDTTYYIAEIKVPDGVIGLKKPLAVTTGGAGSTESVDVVNPIIEIVMPETGASILIHPALVGGAMIVLAAAALMIYRKKLQKAAADAERKGGIR